ncbi:hypothetical protein H0H92_004294 [Tricholoma furcatifolium]|nr:hypothetical protein H0H92_004294 [Tricholoma furcatifolium]
MPTAVATSGPGFKPKSKTEGIDSIYVKAALNAHEGLKTWSTYGSLDYIGIVSWSKEHLELPDDSAELADVPILINRASQHILKVKDLEDYMEKLSTARQRKVFCKALASKADSSNSNDNDNNDSNNTDAEEPPRKRQHGVAQASKRAGPSRKSKEKLHATRQTAQQAGPSPASGLLSMLPPGMGPEIVTQFLKQLVLSMQSAT